MFTCWLDYNSSNSVDNIQNQNILYNEGSGSNVTSSLINTLANYLSFYISFRSIFEWKYGHINYYPMDHIPQETTIFFFFLLTLSWTTERLTFAIACLKNCFIFTVYTAYTMLLGGQGECCPASEHATCTRYGCPAMLYSPGTITTHSHFPCGYSWNPVDKHLFSLKQARKRHGT